jgi:hypothetical protein
MSGGGRRHATRRKRIILAAEITVDASDFGHLEPMLESTLGLLERQGVNEQPEAVIADAGYWHTAQMSGDQRAWDRGADPALSAFFDSLATSQSPCRPLSLGSGRPAGRPIDRRCAVAL